MCGGAFADDEASRTEVDEDGLARICEQDIAGLHIAVVDILPMQVFQRLQNTAQNGQKPGFRNCCVVGGGLLQLLASHPGHHIIGGSQRLKGETNLHDVGVVEPCQQASLIHETRQQCRVFLLRVLRVCGQNRQACMVSPGTETRQIFLDNNLLSRAHRLRQVGDTKATLPQRALYTIISQLHPCGQSNLVSAL